MAMIRLAVLPLALALSLTWGLASTVRAGGCDLCDCNDQRSVCRMQCQQNYKDYSKKLSCETTCAKTFSSCTDTAYQTQQKLNQAAQQSTTTSRTTTSSGSTASGS